MELRMLQNLHLQNFGLYIHVYAYIDPLQNFTMSYMYMHEKSLSEFLKPRT